MPLTEKQSSEVSCRDLIGEVAELRRAALAAENQYADLLKRVPENHQASARNFLHYLTIRRNDLRTLQSNLHRLGLSSLGRLEAYVLPSLEAVLIALHRLEGSEPPAFRDRGPLPDFDTSRNYLDLNARRLFGPDPEGREVRIMVTVPEEAADDPVLVRNLVAAGMDVIRINCSKGGPAEWKRTIDNLRAAEKALGRSCQISMGLGGPNPRTGPLESQPTVIRWKRHRDHFGRITAPIRVALVSSDTISTTDADAVLHLPDELFRQIDSGDEVHVTDTSGRSHRLGLLDRTSEGWLAEPKRGAFVQPGATVELVREGRTVIGGRVAEPPIAGPEQKVRLAPGDRLVVHAGDQRGRGPIHSATGEVVEPARIGCTLPEVIGFVRPRERFYYDDGVLEGVITEVRDNEFVVEVKHAFGGAVRLKSDKTINLPDTTMGLPSLTPRDLKALDFVAEHADIVEMSFVRSARDIAQLGEELDRRNAGHLGVLVKIETRQAFQQFPQLVLTAMRRPGVGVMIARGDMGVELGFGRMAEVQEEILWFCEAAHLPCVWATQVLENLAKKGLPSRAEVTDAAMSSRAECVMLNKGEHLVETMEFLNEVLGRMHGHQDKKRSLMRKLRVSELIAETTAPGENP